ncbi:MAG: hypothetical protein ACMVO5_07260 [Polymorphobacter sp.]|uniref:hypothetical protein n=1 Tax=Polymorphobacter sp. TaxID=1909290 RepID=UPI003A86D64D
MMHDPDPNLSTSFVRALQQRWLLVAGATLAALLAAVLFLRTADYVYTAELRVAAAPGSAGRAGALGGLSGLAALAGVGLENEATPFRLYLDDLTSRSAAAALARDPAVMQRVFADEWQGGGWAPRASLADRLTASLLSHDGAAIAAAAPPDTARLQDWLQRNLRIEEDPRSPVVVLRLSHPDAGFAKALLVRIHEDADARARRRALTRADANIAHLDARLRAVVELGHRQAMIATRAAEAQRLMLARNPAAFAASRLGPATASTGPTSPRAGLVLVLALVLGAGIGIGTALLFGPPASTRS